MKFTKNHMWVRREEGEWLVGISDFAQEKAGDIIFVELPEVGQRIFEGDPFGSFESCKDTQWLLAPFDGEVSRTNEALADTPEKMNEDPYGEGWLIAIKGVGCTPPKEEPMTEEEYLKYVETL